MKGAHMKRWLVAADELLARIEKTLVLVLFALLVAMLTFNIVARNLFHQSFQKTLETAPVLVLWLALIGSTLALKQRRHIKLELLLRFCRPRLRLMARRATSLFGMAVMGILLAAAVQFVRNEIAIFGPWGWTSIIFPLFFAVVLFRYLLRLVNSAQDPQPSAAPAPVDPF